MGEKPWRAAIPKIGAPYVGYYPTDVEEIITRANAKFEADEAEIARLTRERDELRAAVAQQDAAIRRINAGEAIESDYLTDHELRQQAEIDRLRARVESLQAALWLTAEDWMFVRHKEHGHPAGKCLVMAEDELKLLIICNDTFAYACADCEEAELSETVALRRIAEAEGWPGMVRWCQAKGQRGEPIEPVRKSMATFDSLREERDQLRARVEELEVSEQERWRLTEQLEMADHYALSHLSKAGVCTPAEGFRAAGWGWLRTGIDELAAERDKLRAQLRSLTEWRPMAEAPRDGTKVLLLVDGVPAVSWWGSTYGWWTPGWHPDETNPSHGIRGWLPLPEVKP